MEVKLAYNKLHIFKGYHLLSFDICIQNHHHKQDNKTTHPQSFSCPLVISASHPCYSSTALYRQPMTCFLSVWSSLHFLELYINTTIQHVLFFCLASFTQQLFGIHHCCCIDTFIPLKIALL